MLLYLKLPKYLKEWCLFEFGDADGVVKFPRGSAENDVLEMFLDRLPEGMDEPQKEDGDLAIELPKFKSKPQPEFCYLTEPAKKVVAHVIMVRLRIRIWHDLYKVDKLKLPVSSVIYDWMERHGISDDPNSWENLRQMYNRQRESYRRGKPTGKTKI